MLKRLKNLSTGGLIMICLLFVAGLIAVLFAAPKAAIGLGALPFLFGAVKVRDDMTIVRTVKYTHSSATVKDTIYLLNSIPMLAVNSADANVENVFVIAGQIEYAKTSAQAWTGGVLLYWDNGNSVFTTASSGNTLAGRAAEAAANPSSTGQVILMPMLTGRAALENTITDPGNAGAIPVTVSGVCAMTSAGAETRTLAIPTYLGQQIALIDDTHVGNIVITSAQAVNQAGNTTLTFGAAADACVLTAMTVGGALRWRVTANDGVALS